MVQGVGQSRRAGGRDRDGVPLPAEGEGERPGDGALVLPDEDMKHDK